MELNAAKRFFCTVFCAILILAIAAGAFGTLDRTLESRAVGLPTTTKPVVILDAGHGGMDGGAVANGITEKDLNLAITKKVKELCTLFGFEVRMTREEDISIHDEDKSTVRAQKNSDLKNRLKIMTSDPNAVVVSIHMNKFTESRIRGAQIFYAPKSQGSDLLAQTLQDNFKRFLQPDNTRQTKKADSALFLLYNNTVNPAVLVECGFISNPEEAALLSSEEYQDQVAFTICYSLLQFYDGRLVDEVPETSEITSGPVDGTIAS